MTIKELLDLKLEEALANKDKLPVIARVHQLSGFAKTPIIKEWLSEHDYNYFEVNAANRKLYEANGNKYLFTEKEIDEMSKPKTIIFIDDYDWGRQDVRLQLLELLRHSVVYSSHLSTLFSTFSVVGDTTSRIDSVQLDKLLMFILVTHPESAHKGSDLSGIPYTDIEKKLLGL